MIPSILIATAFTPDDVQPVQCWDQCLKVSAYGSRPEGRLDYQIQNSVQCGRFPCQWGLLPQQQHLKSHGLSFPILWSWGKPFFIIARGCLCFHPSSFVVSKRPLIQILIGNALAHLCWIASSRKAKRLEHIRMRNQHWQYESFVCILQSYNMIVVFLHNFSEQQLRKGPSSELNLQGICIYVYTHIFEFLRVAVYSEHWILQVPPTTAPGAALGNTQYFPPWQSVDTINLCCLFEVLGTLFLLLNIIWQFRRDF